MTHRKDKTLAVLLCAASTLSVGTFPRVEAAPLFPPPHTVTVFTRVPTTPAAAVSPGPWYRAAPDAVTRLHLDGLPAASVASSATVTPWYRAAN
ncbi:MAG: hypothetical protein AB7Q81_19055 [Gammaproteobacteria bacterium]